MKPGQLITLEGIEGAGKTTAQRFIVQYLQKRGLSVLATREPGGTKIAEAIRQVLLSKVDDEVMYPETELLLMFASRMQHVHAHILPALLQGTWVVSDRFVDASYAYQGGGRLIDRAVISALDRLTVGDVQPILTFLLDLSPEQGAQRLQARGGKKDRIEQEKISFFERVREAYLEIALRNPTRFQIIDASSSENQVQWGIENRLETLLKGECA